MHKDNNCETEYFHEASFTDEKGQLKTLKVPVVQELVRHGLSHTPLRFIRTDLDESSAVDGLVPEAELEHISLEKLRPDWDPEGRIQELAKLAHGVKEWGMFVVTEHGISPDVLRAVREVVKGFFGLSFEEKKRSVGTYMSSDNMGYGRNFVKSDDQTLDWIDRLSMKATPTGADGGLHVWPQNPPNFREAIENYVTRARVVLDELLKALAESFTLEREAFMKSFDPEESEINVRVNYYPPCPEPDRTFGLTPHTDASALTLLTEFDASGGLQMRKHHKWLSVSWPKDTLLVNVGDLLEIMSNGLVESPWHRAVTQMATDRFSVALFYRPPSRTVIGPIKIAGSDDKITYRNVVVGDYVDHFYNISPVGEKQAILFAMV